MDRKQLLLDRLDAIGHSLEKTGQALALLGLGSVGTETARIDAYSDLDFFAVVKAGHKADFLKNLDWLTSIRPAAYYFQNTVDGFKFLFDDDIFCEFAVFEPDELASIPFAEGRIVWRAEGVADSIRSPQRKSTHEVSSVEWRLGEALTNLYVGLGRYHRGEKLSAASFIQSYAVNQILNLAPLIEPETPAFADQFNAERRFEKRFPKTAAHLPHFVQGYERSRESALAILAFLEAHFEVNPAIKAAIVRLATSE